ncbi:Uncharacterized protein Rs2_18357 [Raphanus sativus]|nr:Uncharacterized protein Rs2_18357 [Raphanus sativus]
MCSALKQKRLTHSQEETMTVVSLLVAFTVLSLSSPPLEAIMSPDISPLFPTPGSSEMSPSPSGSFDMPTIPSSLSPPNPDAVSPLDSSPVGSPLPVSSSVSLVSLTPLSLLLVFLVFMLPYCRL